MSTQAKIAYDGLTDVELARLVGVRDPMAVRLVTQRNNQRLFRAAWSILKSRSEAEDVVQAAYLNAFAAIGSFEGRSSLSTWLTRIAINEALGRDRSRKRRVLQASDSVTFLDDYKERLMRGSASNSPDANLARMQIRGLLEDAITRLPAEFRTVFVLREIEELNVEETAEALQIKPATVKTRHLRARRRLQKMLEPDLRNVLSSTFPFAGADCERITERVIASYCKDKGE